MYYVYAYENKINGKIYIGQTYDLNKRDSFHTTHNELLIEKKIKQYGRNSFQLFTVSILDTKEEADQEEIFWIAEMRRYLGKYNVYNIANGGPVPMRGRKHSQETKEKMSSSRTGVKRKPFTQEHKNQISKSKTGISMVNGGQFKRKISPDMIQKISQEIRSGGKQKLVALKYGISTRSVRRIMGGFYGPCNR